MISKRLFAVTAVGFAFAIPVAQADVDTEASWKSSPIDRVAQRDTRTQGTTTQGTGADAVANPGNYYY
jgi:hypothetical protein